MICEVAGKWQESRCCGVEGFETMVGGMWEATRNGCRSLSRAFAGGQSRDTGR